MVVAALLGWVTRHVTRPDGRRWIGVCVGAGLIWGLLTGSAVRYVDPPAANDAGLLWACLICTAVAGIAPMVPTLRTRQRDGDRRHLIPPSRLQAGYTDTSR